jgi:hypothetical protein
MSDDAPRITLRCPQHLLEAAQSAADAAGQKLGVWIRSLIEQATGIEAGDMRPGYERLSPEQRSEFGRAGAEARHGAKKPAKRGRKRISK